MAKRNVNVTHAANFRFVMTNKLQTVEFYVQEFNGLGMSLNEVQPNNYAGQIFKRPGDTIVFNDLNIQVLADEDYEVLDEIYDFMDATRGIQENKLDWGHDFTGLLFLSTNRNNIKKQIEFKNCWIRDMGDWVLSANQQDATPILIPVTIAYDKYIIKNVT